MKILQNNKKKKLYAIFQFTSFTGTFFFIFAMLFISASAISTTGLPSSHDWAEKVTDAMKFSDVNNTSQVAGLMMYCSFIFWISSWTAGLRIFSIPNRTIFDSLFLVFIVVPLFANIFTLMAQIVDTKVFLVNSKVDKGAIIAEQTKLIKLNIKKEKEEQKKAQQK